MTNNENAQEILSKINPLLKDFASDETISAISKYITKDNVETNDQDLKNAREFVTKAKELLDEDYFAEPLNYISATRYGLRVSDLEKLMGTGWDKDMFIENAKSLGLEFLEERGEILVIPYLKFKALFFDLLDNESQDSFHSDIAFHLNALPPQDPFRNSEIFYHLFNSKNLNATVEHFSKLNNQQLLQAADILGFAFSNNINIEFIDALASFEGLERLNLVRRMMNEVYVSILNHAPIETAENFISMLTDKAEEIEAKSPSIPNSLLVSLGLIRKSTSQMRKGDQDKTKEYFEKSLQNLDKSFNKYKNANDFTWEDTETIFNIGFIALEMHQPKAAELIFNVTFNILDVKDKNEAADSPKKFYIASWYINVCRALLGTNNKEIGTAIFEKGKKVFVDTLKIKAQVNSKSQNQQAGDFELMNMYNDFADLCAAFDNKDQAISNYENSLVIGERLAENAKDNVQLLFAPSITLTKLGAFYASINDNNKAEDYFNKALTLRLELLDKNPKDIRLLNDVASSYFAVAQLIMSQPNKSDIINILLKRNEIIDRIVELDPESENSVMLTMDSNIMIGDYYLSSEKLEDSAKAFDRARAIVAKMMGKQVSENILSRIALLHLKSGMLYEKAKKEKESQDNFKTAIQIWEQLYKSTGKEAYKANIEKVQPMIKD